MLVIRLQRTGRKGHAQFRVVVQDSRRTPTSGKVVAQLGHYDPHTKEIVLNKEKAQFYLDNGAQPSDRIAVLFNKEGITLPKWVTLPVAQKRTTRNPEKLRKNQPKEEAPKAEEKAEAEEPAAEVAEEAAAEAPAVQEAPEAEAEK
jgi:small subunit ribosomal protein S16